MSYSPKARLISIELLGHFGVVTFSLSSIVLLSTYIVTFLCLLLRLCDEVSVLSGRCGEGKMEELVDSQENLLHHCRAQLV